MPSRVCVYCRVEQDVAAFNVEHVLSQAFGTFEQNLTLRCVCEGCNAYFGRTLELYFTRDGIEGIQRLQRGIKPVAEIGELRRQRIQSIVIAEGPNAGVHADLIAERGELRVTPVLQAGLRVEGKWLYFTEKYLADRNSILPGLITGINLLANAEAGYDRLVALLAARGIKFQKQGIGPPLGEGDEWAALDISTRVDMPIQRCIAKIVFNYLVWAAGAEFALRDELNVVRSFVRHGVKAPYALVVPTGHPVLADDLPRLRQTEGHLLTVHWSPQGPHLIGQLSLFNEINYRVGLIHDFPAPLPPIRSGHHFDWQTRRISKLSDAPRGGGD